MEWGIMILMLINSIDGDQSPSLRGRNSQQQSRQWPFDAEHGLEERSMPAACINREISTMAIYAYDRTPVIFSY